MRVCILSLECWDDTWRRNQHLAAELMRQRFVDELLFVEPLRRGRTALVRRSASDGIVVVTPSTPIPKSVGGLAHVGRLLRREIVAGCDLLWVNDAVLGARSLDGHVPTVYDVTDDWREAGFPARIRRRIVRAENLLATRARTIVCSPVLRERWRQRYGVEAALVPNGIDVEAWSRARPRRLDGPGPHVGYVGTLHEHRLDVDLVAAVAHRPEIGTVHLIGPNCLEPGVRERIAATPKVVVHGPVPAADVPSWMTAMDVLISPHLVNDFTLSLDAIKAYEYAASGKPVVATATSGFPLAPGAPIIAAPIEFAERTAQVAAAPHAPPIPRGMLTSTAWSARAGEFWLQARAAAGSLSRRPATPEMAPRPASSV